MLVSAEAEPAPASGAFHALRKDVATLLLLASLTVIARIGMLGTAQVWWEDEHTFGLMAQDVLRGNLPYVEAFDNKPPGLFLLLALFFKIFGSDFIALRAFGDLSVFVTAVLVRALARRAAGEGPALIGAVMVIGLSALPIAQSTLSEWPAIMFVTGALVCAVRRPGSAPAAAGAGVLMAFAVLTRMNLAFAAVAMGCVYAASSFFRGPFPGRALPALSVGALLPVAALFLAYAWAGRLDLLILGMIVVPLSYGDGMSYANLLAFSLTDVAWTAKQAPLFNGPILFVCITSAMLLLVRRRVRAAEAPRDRWRGAMVATVGLAVAFSIYVSGGAGAHYFVQLFPFLALVVACALGPRRSDDPARPVAALASILSALLPIGATAPASIAALRDPAGQVRNTPEWAASRYIAEDRRPGDRVWALYHHVVLLHLDEPPIARVGIHPGNMNTTRIVRPLAEAGYAPAEPLWANAALRARYVIAPKGFLAGERSIFYLNPNEAARLRAMLAPDYDIGFAEGTVEVLRRRD